MEKKKKKEKYDFGSDPAYRRLLKGLIKLIKAAQEIEGRQKKLWEKNKVDKKVDKVFEERRRNAEKEERARKGIPKGIK